MLRLLIYGSPGTPVFELGERLSEFHKLEYFTIEKVPEEHESYFDDKIRAVPFDTGDFMSGSESQNMIRDPKTLALDEELESVDASIPDAGPYEDCLSSQELFVIDSIDQGIVTTEIPECSLVVWATHIVFLYADERQVIYWFAKRFKCPTCNTVFHMEEKPPVVKGKCDRCGTVLERQEKDEPRFIQEQFKVWKNSFWKFDEKSKEGRFKRINVDRMRTFNDMVSRIDLWVRDSIVTSDSWYNLN